MAYEVGCTCLRLWNVGVLWLNALSWLLVWGYQLSQRTARPTSCHMRVGICPHEEGDLPLEWTSLAQPGSKIQIRTSFNITWMTEWEWNVQTASHHSRLITALAELLLWSPYGIGQTIIFFCLVSSIFYLFSWPNLSRRRSDVYHTSTLDVALVRI